MNFLFAFTSIGEEAAEEEKEFEVIDTYDLVDPVDVSAKIPADFFANLVRIF